MKVIVLSVSDFKESKYGGKYKTAVMMSLDDSKTYTLFCYDNHPKSKKFMPYLVPQAILENVGLVEINGKKFIDGNSDFTYIGLRHS
jgi:hypothetical protein